MRTREKNIRENKLPDGELLWVVFHSLMRNNTRTGRSTAAVGTGQRKTALQTEANVRVSEFNQRHTLGKEYFKYYIY